jgi:hypothetical protein
MEDESSMRSGDVERLTPRRFHRAKAAWPWDVLGPSSSACCQHFTVDLSTERVH